jgi:nucleotide-binding universal stress UspA family protein
VLADNAADEAILNEAKRRKHNLIVMGVGRRPGEGAEAVPSLSGCCGT